MAQSPLRSSLAPPTILEWYTCYDLQSTSFIMINVLDLGTIDAYKCNITGFHNRFGPQLWFLLYQADVRFRVERLERIATELDIAQEKKCPGVILSASVKWRQAWTIGLKDKELDCT